MLFKLKEAYENILFPGSSIKKSYFVFVHEMSEQELGVFILQRFITYFSLSLDPVMHPSCPRAVTNSSKAYESFS